MATRTNISKTSPKIQPVGGIRISVWLLGLVIVLTAILIGLSSASKASSEETLAGENRVNAAWTARNQGLADAYARIHGSMSAKALIAWGARYQGQADAFAARSGTMSQKALNAWAARYQGIADREAIEQAAISQKSVDTWAARLQGIADQYVVTHGGMSQRALDAWAARYQGQALLIESQK